MPQKAKPPSHLTGEIATWWRSVAADYVLAPHHLRLLTLAGEAWDRVVEARETIAADGSYFSNRFGEPRAHPALAVERDSRLAFARLVRELGLSEDAPAESRPPALTGRYERRG